MPRSIPACAGETITRPAQRCWSRVYPRVCGGNQCPSGIAQSGGGLSPRVRGNPLASGADRGRPGLSPRVRGKRGRVDEGTKRKRSIPACAGETPPKVLNIRPGRVYPRVCGGNKDAARAFKAGNGLSPRVRGKRAGAAASSGKERSIPACAGETSPGAARCRQCAVYPRVCGGNGWGGRATSCRGVYPRVCGGNISVPVTRIPIQGLSPRVRGKHAPS